MSVYDLYQSYLDQMQQSPVMQSPVMDPNYLLYLQQQGGGEGDNRFTNVVDPSQANAGITSLSGLSDYFSPAGMIGGALFGPVGVIAGRGIGNLISNIQNPNTTMFGQPTQAYQTALEKMSQEKGNFQQFTGGDGNRGNIGSDRADYSRSAETGAKGGFGYGL